MKLPPLHVVLAAAALAWAAILTAGTALAASPPEARKLKLSAYEVLLEKRAAQARENSDAARAAHVKAVQPRFDRLCTFKPVMTDAEMDGCRQAFKL
jgi:hypothetical protein